MRIRSLPALLLLATALVAQEDELPPDEVADLAGRYVERGIESMREGSYDEARLRFQKALKRDPRQKRAQLGIAECHRLVGAYAKAEKVLGELLRQRPGDREATVALARIDLVRGRTADMRAPLKKVIETGGEGPDLTGLRARCLLASALARMGRRDDARTVLDRVIKYYERRAAVLADAAFNKDLVRDQPGKARPLSREMTVIAGALRLYVELRPLDHEFIQNAYELVGYATDLDRDNWEAWIEQVRVTRVERGRAISRARKIRDLVTRRNPELADLYVEVARSLMTGFSQGEAKRMALQALQVNRNQTGARAILAQILLEDNEYSKAEEQIEKGLAVNPRHRALLSLKATYALLRGEKEEFERGMAGVLAVDRTYGEGYHLAGLVVAARQRRYDRAVKLVKRGLRIDPMNFDAHASYGIFLANLGRAEEARQALAESMRLFPFDHPVRNNFKKVLDYVIGTMTEMRTEHFVIRFDPAEYPVLSLYLPELLEDCWEEMTRRYGFTPQAPVLVDVFRDPDDFSVRTIGLPGIPALGACFGGLITLDSPQALPPGNFSWASTARHEFAHVMSLQLSGGQVPRWFTEGLSVLEERPLDTGWSRDARYERVVFDEWHTDTLPKIGTFDAMFRTPRVGYAYYVGGLMLQFLQERSGERGIVEALRLYGKDRPMREVFKQAFGLGLEEFDTLFRKWIAKRVGTYRIQPDYTRILSRLRTRALKDPEDGEALIRIAWAYFQQRSFVDAGAYIDRARRLLKPDHKLLLLLDANLSLRAGRMKRSRELFEKFFQVGGEDYDARMKLAPLHAKDPARFEAELRKAKAAWPLQVTGKNPYALLRRLYLTQGKQPEALRELEEAAAIASKNIGMRLTLAREYVRAGRDKQAITVLEEAIRITMFDHRILGGLLPLYRRIGDHKKAIRTARSGVAWRGEKDDDELVGSRWLDLAEVLFEAGKAEEAGSALAEAKKLANAEDPRIAALEAKLKAAVERGKR